MFSWRHLEISSDLLFRILSGFAVMIISFSVKHRSHRLEIFKAEVVIYGAVTVVIVAVAVRLVLIFVLLEEECFPTYTFDDAFSFFN